jgi:peptide/nickel transport system substrate-binding protein
VVGFGPFSLVDYVAGSSITYKKNPTYWEKDREGRSLPYVNYLKVLILPDPSTRIAAIRSGKIDLLQNLEWRDAEDVLRTNPDLLSTGEFSYMMNEIRLNQTLGPTADLKVRRALAMAIDRQAIIDGFYKGHSVFAPSYMAPPIPMGATRLPTMEELSASTRELFEYNPTKAKQLLEEAGYPQGFKTTITITSAYEQIASIVQSYWAAINVDASINVVAPATSTKLAYAKPNTEPIMIGGGMPCWRNWAGPHQPGQYYNLTNLKDDVLLDMMLKAKEQYVDAEKWQADWKKICDYILDHVYELSLPGPNVKTVWQPWLKGYHGECFIAGIGNTTFAAYTWISK